MKLVRGNCASTFQTGGTDLMRETAAENGPVLPGAPGRARNRPGMATGDPLQRQPGSSERPVGLHGFQGILRAVGVKRQRPPAVRREKSLPGKQPTVRRTPEIKIYWPAFTSYGSPLFQ